MLSVDKQSKRKWGVRFKHLPGKHDQRSHGFRGGASTSQSMTGDERMDWYNKINLATYDRMQKIPNSGLLDNAVTNVVWGDSSRDSFIRLMNEQDAETPPAPKKDGSYAERMAYGFKKLAPDYHRSSAVEISALSRASGLTRNEIDAAYSYQGMDKFMHWEARFGLDQLRLRSSAVVYDPKIGLKPTNQARRDAMKQMGFKDPGKFYDYLQGLRTGKKKERRWGIRLKHLPGRHNQLTHGGWAHGGRQSSPSMNAPASVPAWARKPANPMTFVASGQQPVAAPAAAPVAQGSPTNYVRSNKKVVPWQNYQIAGKTGAQWVADSDALSAKKTQDLLRDLQKNNPGLSNSGIKTYVDRLNEHRRAIMEEGLEFAQQYKLSPKEESDLMENLLKHDSFDKYSANIAAPYIALRSGGGSSSAFWAAVGRHHDANPHHPEYWVDKTTKIAKKMPTITMIEMVSDWIGTAKRQGTPKDSYYRANGGHEFNLHPDTRWEAERALGIKTTPFPHLYPTGFQFKEFSPNHIPGYGIEAILLGDIPPKFLRRRWGKKINKKKAIPVAKPSNETETKEHRWGVRLKHLPGRHNQLTHGGWAHGRNMASTSSPSSSASAPGSFLSGSYAPYAASYVGWNQSGTGIEKDGLKIDKTGKRFYVSESATGRRLAGFVSANQAKLFAGTLQQNYDFVNMPPNTKSLQSQVDGEIKNMMMAAGLKPVAAAYQRWGTKALAQVGGTTRSGPKAAPAAPPKPAAPPPAPPKPAAPSAPAYNFTPSNSDLTGWTKSSGVIVRGTKGPVSYVGQVKNGIAIARVGANYVVTDTAMNTRLGSFKNITDARLFGSVLGRNHDFVNNPMTDATTRQAVRQAMTQMANAVGGVGNWQQQWVAQARNSLAPGTGTKPAAAPKPAAPPAPPPPPAYNFTPNPSYLTGWQTGYITVNMGRGVTKQYVGQTQNGLNVVRIGAKNSVVDSATGTRLGDFKTVNEARLFAGTLSQNHDFVKNPMNVGNNGATVRTVMQQMATQAGLYSNTPNWPQSWATQALAQVNAGKVSRSSSPSAVRAPAPASAPKPAATPAAPDYTPKSTAFQGWASGSLTSGGKTISAISRDGLVIYKEGARFQIYELSSGHRLGAVLSEKQAQVFADTLARNHDFIKNPLATNGVHNLAAAAEVEAHLTAMLNSAGIKKNTAGIQRWASLAAAQLKSGTVTAPAKPAVSNVDPADLFYKKAVLSDPSQITTLPSARIDYATARQMHPNDKDPLLKNLLHDQGFDGVPSVVNKAKLDSLIKSGKVVESWRGVAYNGNITQSQMIQNFKSGDYFAGVGVHGNGTYFSNKKSTADNYDSGGRYVIRIGIRKDVKMMTESKLRSEMATAKNNRIAYITKMLNAGGMSSARSSRYRRELNLLQGYNSGNHPLFGDIGRYATAIGVDVIHVPGGNGGIRNRYGSTSGEDFYVVLNRTAVYVEQ